MSEPVPISPAICPVGDCTSTVDIVFQSSDGELFGAHQRNLELYTEGFPIAGSTVASSDPVNLNETADVLRLMLRYTHNIRQPVLDDIPFALLASLAEAAEKYMIYSAMESCRVQMKLAATAHPDEVFLYSVRHDYLVLADQAAVFTLKNPTAGFFGRIRAAGCQDDIVIRWLRYRDCWMEVLLQLQTYQPDSHDCTRWHQLQVEVFREVSLDPSSLVQISAIVDKHAQAVRDFYRCSSAKHKWVRRIEKRLAKVPKYSKIQCSESGGPWDTITPWGSWP